MPTKCTKAAAILAGIIGAMAVFAGGRVLLGTQPDYYVIDWLTVYNFVMGVVSIAIAAMLIWRNSRYARPAAIAIFAAHGLVMLILLTAYRDVVARDSLVAMTVRLAAWAIILALLFAHRGYRAQS